ncbi:hypothetical protein [Pontibacter rugosus]|uniref:Uncharacterized protein n=1 Tax=Pontibacter rugosus TaxID=1745966 RepID=A0ABW3SW54_9BACT
MAFLPWAHLDLVFHSLFHDGLLLRWGIAFLVDRIMTPLLISCKSEPHSDVRAKQLIREQNSAHHNSLQVEDYSSDTDMDTPAVAPHGRHLRRDHLPLLRPPGRQAHH